MSADMRNKGEDNQNYDNERHIVNLCSLLMAKAETRQSVSAYYCMFRFERVFCNQDLCFKP